MIIIGGTVVHPIYTRIITSRSSIYAEIALHRAEIEVVKVGLGSYFEMLDYGRLYIDAIIQQGETYIVRAYDPLAYAARYMICDTRIPDTLDAPLVYTGKSTQVLYDLLHEQYDYAKSQIDVSIIQPPSSVGEDMVVEIRYDVLFDAYRQIPEQLDPHCRLNITPWAGQLRQTQYQPQYGSDVPILLAPAMIYDYMYHGAAPNYAIVSGDFISGQTKRHRVSVPDPAPVPRRETYLNVPHETDETKLKTIGTAALTAKKMDQTSITLKMLARHVPANLKPADSVYLQDDPTTHYAVQSIEYTTGAQGDFAYITIGGKAVTVADRINAIIAADYAARY